MSKLALPLEPNDLTSMTRPTESKPARLAEAARTAKRSKPPIRTCVDRNGSKATSRSFAACRMKTFVRFHHQLTPKIPYGTILACSSVPASKHGPLPRQNLGRGARNPQQLKHRPCRSPQTVKRQNSITGSQRRPQMHKRKQCQVTQCVQDTFLAAAFFSSRLP